MIKKFADMMYTDSHSDHVKLSYYGEVENVRFMIVCPHASMGLPFLNRFPEIYTAIKVPIMQFMRYLSVEQDFGSGELAHNIARFLHENFQINTLIVEPQMPRAILDPGRIYPHCIRNIIEFQQYPKLYENLRRVHQHYISRLNHLIELLNSRRGILLDLHTMSPFSPEHTKEESYTEAMLETPSTLGRYTEIYLVAHRNGIKRDIQFLTGDPDHHVYADPVFLANMTNQFSKNGYQIAYDRPYRIASHLMGFQLMKKTRAASIDIPKHYLSTKDSHDPEFDLSNLIIDDQKIQKIGQNLAIAVGNTLYGDDR
ncbi:MAG: hypothetical protein ACO2ZM_03355 [Francisellaceae bacterium]